MTINICERCGQPKEADTHRLCSECRKMWNLFCFNEREKHENESADVLWEEFMKDNNIKEKVQFT